MEPRVKVGLLGAVHPNMPGDDRGVIAATIAGMRALAEKQGFDLSVWEKPVAGEEDAECARKFLDAEETDFNLLFNGSLPFGRIMLPLSRLRGRLGFWSVPEPAKSGVLQLNSFCGVNLMGSLVAHYTAREGFPGKWFYGAHDSPVFLERFLCTLRALRAIKALSTLRIGQIGGLANGFENMYLDERDVARKFGAYVQTRHSVEEIVARAEGCDEAAVEAEVKAMLAEGVSGCAAADIGKSARVCRALRDFARDNGYGALAVSCWPRFQEVYGTAVCAALSRLNAQGIPSVCEGDISSLLVMAIMRCVSGGTPALNDLVDFDEADGSLNLWHCGVAAADWADAAGVQWGEHFNIGKYEGENWKGDGVVAAMQFRPGAVTVANMTADLDRLFVLTGDVLKDKKGFYGSGAWVGNLRINGTPAGIPTIINTIATGLVHHHYTSGYGDMTNELNEFAAWTGMRVLDPIPYAPYLQTRRAGHF